jgi:WhiB family redox-sensing transcriptional regulator
MVPDWQTRARCAGTELALWFPEGGVNAEPARRICRCRPVTRQCLDAAMTGGERHGVWGGTSPTQRTMLRHRLAEQVAS